MTADDRRQIGELVAAIAERKRALCHHLGEAGHLAEELCELIGRLAKALPADREQRAALADLVPLAIPHATAEKEQAQFQRAADWFDRLCDRLTEHEEKAWVLPFIPK